MDTGQVQYYKDMLNRDRGQLFYNEGKMIGIITFFIGDDDEKYLHKEAWTVIEDDPQGATVYIDQFLSPDHDFLGKIYKEFDTFLQWIKEKFPTVKRAKWVRVNAAFRKRGIKEGVTSNVHTKSIK